MIVPLNSDRYALDIYEVQRRALGADSFTHSLLQTFFQKHREEGCSDIERRARSGRCSSLFFSSLLTRSLIFVMMPYVRMKAAISATSLHQQEYGRIDSEVLWILPDPSVILFIESMGLIFLSGMVQSTFRSLLQH